MLAPTLLPDPTRLHLRQLVQVRQTIRAVVATTSAEAACPVCEHRATRVHSRYVRRVADLPWHGVPLCLELHLRRFFCDQTDCPRHIFAERLPGIVAPYARRTLQLAEALTLIGFALGGEAGARLARELTEAPAIASPDTLLRLVRREPLPAAPSPRIVGVDDFAFHRGMRYGTILVDLEQRRVVDLLPDREAETFAAWLQAHPGVAVISRDRGGAYAEGARQAAPAAQQVADRFHLLQNLGAALDRVLTREHRLLTQIAEGRLPPLVQAGVERADEALLPPAVAEATTRGERAQCAAEARRQARYERVVQLQRAGHSLQAIARLAGLARNTVRRYLRSPAYPEPAPRRRRVQACDPFASYLRTRWQAGQRNSAVLLAALQRQGFTGSASTLRHYLRPWRSGPCRPGRRPNTVEEWSAAQPPPPRRRTFSPRQTRWVLLRPMEDLDAEERAYRAALCAQSPTIALAQALVATFGAMVRARAGVRAPGALDHWLADTEQSEIPELVSVANGIRRDYDAVVAALSSPWSQGQTEGQINRLKLLKRSAYGRAKLDLLRQRVLRRSP